MLRVQESRFSRDDEICTLALRWNRWLSPVRQKRGLLRCLWLEPEQAPPWVSANVLSG